jgi:dolichyl-phosphate beta-glucosyltransferase
MNVHLVLPCFRESARLPAFLTPLCREMDRLEGVRVLAVEDGSGPGEVERMSAVIEKLRKEYSCLLPLKILPGNIGKGGAVYAGWAESGGAEWLGFVDADGSCPAGEVARLIELARRESSPPRALFASRVKMLGRKIERQLKRHLLGRIYATMVSELLDIPVYDSQCGLKLVPAAAYQKIRPALSVNGFAFDAELLLGLLHSGSKVIEVPIDWHETPGGKIRLVRDSLRMARDLLTIRGRSRSTSWQLQMRGDAC